jgi:hypothetical protein
MISGITFIFALSQLLKLVETCLILTISFPVCLGTSTDEYQLSMPVYSYNNQPAMESVAMP